MMNSQSLTTLIICRVSIIVAVATCLLGCQKEALITSEVKKEIETCNFDAIKQRIEYNRLDIRSTDENGLQLIHLAISYRCYDLIEMLIQKGVDINNAPVTNLNNPGIKLMPLSWAISRNDIVAVKILLSNNADVNYSDNGTTPLMVAASVGNLDIVRLLVKAGADVNAMNVSGRTPLMIATHRGHHNIAHYLSELHHVNESTQPSNLTHD